MKQLLAGWPGWAHGAQRAPEGQWSTWLFLGGRGSGKTRAGAEWLNRRADERDVRLALVAPTLHDAREVMIEGPSGLRWTAPQGRRPAYEPARRRLVWPSGAVGHVFSAEDPESLRGPQFHAGWADEFCAWRRGAEVLAMLRLGLRLGKAPRLTVTTTPKPQAALRDLMSEPSTAQTHATTRSNARNLSQGFVDQLQTLYGGSRREAQELEGLVLSGDGAMWTPEIIAGCRGSPPEAFDQVVVGLDPPATSGGDACGIVVVGRAGGIAYVLADRTVRGRRPLLWAQAVADAAAAYRAHRVIAEVNQGGEMVETVLAMAQCSAAVKPVRAGVSKAARAEPVAVLYEQGRVVHAASVPQLEAELLAFGDETAKASPDRVDALVWAVSELLLARAASPRLSALRLD